MKYPKFFDEVNNIELIDNLSILLGASEGKIEISYLEIVKMAGHSCPTVAGAYLMTLKALDKLYPNSIPIRGNIKVKFKDDINLGVTGVISNVVSNITGACSNSGFKGLNGNFSRNNLMSFNCNDVDGIIRFTRIDNNKSIDINYNPNIVLPDSNMQKLMGKVIGGIASELEVNKFKKLWQDRVKRILIDNFDNKKLIELKNIKYS